MSKGFLHEIKGCMEVLGEMVVSGLEVELELFRICQHPYLSFPLIRSLAAITEEVAKLPDLLVQQHYHIDS